MACCEGWNEGDGGSVELGWPDFGGTVEVSGWGSDVGGELADAGGAFGDCVWASWRIGSGVHGLAGFSD